VGKGRLGCGLEGERKGGAGGLVGVEKVGIYFAERTLPKKTSSTSEGLREGTRSRVAGHGVSGGNGGCGQW